MFSEYLGVICSSLPGRQCTAVLTVPAAAPSSQLQSQQTCQIEDNGWENWRARHLLAGMMLAQVQAGAQAPGCCSGTTLCTQISAAPLTGRPLAGNHTS